MEEKEENEPLEEILAEAPREELMAPTMSFPLEEELIFGSHLAFRVALGLGK